MDPKNPRRLLTVAASLLISVPLFAAGTALSELRAAAPAPALPVVVPVSVAAVQPGSSITPEFSDPVRTRMILKLIQDVHDGNPMPFPKKDGSVWTNRERTLPVNPDPKWYREYTLLPPAGTTSDITVGGKPYRISPPRGTRGAERIIIGGGRDVYYTPDHYATFIPLTIR